MNVWTLVRICICLALMKWASMPFWGAVILFSCLQTNASIVAVGALLLSQTAISAMLLSANQNEAEDER